MDKSLDVGCKSPEYKHAFEKEQRVQELRQIFLQGKLSVDADRLASKIMSFEQEMDNALSKNTTKPS